MKKRIAAIAFLSPFVLASAYAANIPADMMFDGKPIDSLCFNLQENTNTIDLQKCGAKSQNYVVKDQKDILNKKGYTGYNWQDPSTQAPGGYTYYKFFPTKDKKYWVYAINNGGGSGEFTGIFLVARKDANTLTIENVASGDRCNGGIQDVSEKNHALTFSKNLTSYDLITLADKKLPDVKAYDDLASCAACCVAKAFYTINDMNVKFTHVTLNTTKVANMPEQGKYAACFNKLLGSQGKSLTQAKLNQFTEQFSKTCVNAQ